VKLGKTTFTTIILLRFDFWRKTRHSRSTVVPAKRWKHFYCAAKNVGHE